MPYSVLILFLILQTTLLLVSARQTDLVVAFDKENREISVKQLTAAINNYYVESGTYPATTTALAAMPGYEYLKNIDRSFQSLATTTNLDDSVFKYKRVTVFSQDPYDHPLTDTEYLDATRNTCGTGDFATSTDWCGSTNTKWWKHETRESIQDDLARERKRLHRLLDKFAAWYNGDVTVSTINGVWGNNFPSPGSSAAKLTTLVTGFSQTATTCSGVYTWNGIPFDCTDLYSVWGTPTVYNYVSSSHITLMTKTPYTRSDGTALYVSTEESL